MRTVESKQPGGNKVSCVVVNNGQMRVKMSRKAGVQILMVFIDRTKIT